MSSFLQVLRRGVHRLTHPGAMAIFASGNLTAMGLRMIAGLLTARVISPTELGAFSAIGIVLGYLSFLQLGILTGLNRELPFYMGSGDVARARQLASAAHAWALLITGLAVAGMVGMGVYQGLNGQVMLAVGWVAQSIGAVVIIYGTYYLEATFRSAGDFAKLSAVGVAQNVVNLAMVPVVAALGFYGLAVRQATVGATYLGILWRARPLRVLPRWHTPSMRHLFKIGAPIFAVGQLWSLWSLLDVTLVFRITGAEGLGLYQIALITGAAVALFSNSVAQVLYPRMVAIYAQTQSVAATLRIARRPTITLCTLAVPGIAIGWLLLPVVIAWLLPEYTDGVEAAQWQLVAQAILFLKPMINIFNTVKRQDLYVVTILAGTAVYVAAVFALGSRGWTLDVFPKSMALGNATYIGLGYLFAAYLARKEKRSGA